MLANQQILETVLTPDLSAKTMKSNRLIRKNDSSQNSAKRF